LRFRSGLRVNYLGTWTSGWNRFDFRWRTDFPGGVLIQKKQFSDLYAARLDPALAMTGPLFKDEAEPLLPIALPPAEHFIDDTRLLLARFVEAIQAGKPVETSGKDHLKSLALVHAIIESAEHGQRVALADFYARHGLEMGWLE
jgi:predicted dehydrogenase